MNFTVFPRRGKGALLQILCLAIFSGAGLAASGCERGPTAPSAPASSLSDDSGEPDDSEGSESRADRADAVDDGTDMRVVTSDELPANPERIVSMAPNVTEIVFELGAGPRLVGVTRFCDYPAAANELPKIGGIVDVDLEAIISKRPDLVVGTTSGADPEIARQLDDAGIAYGFVRMDNLAETYHGIEKIGEFVGEGEAGAKLAADMKARIDRLAEAADPDQRPSVLMVYGRKPLVAAGPDTFGHELIELAGGQNLMADAKTAYPRLDIEKVISLNPDRIIDAAMEEENHNAAFWKQYPSLDAVSEDKLYLIKDPVVLRPAPRLVEGFETIRMAVHGDQP